MSHTSKHMTKITDLREMVKLAKAKGYAVREGNLTTIDLWGSKGIDVVVAIRLKDWKYEIGITKEGDIMYDAFGTEPPAVKHLRDLIVDYNEKVVMKNIPIDKVSNFVVNNVGTKREIILTYT